MTRGPEPSRPKRGPAEQREAVDRPLDRGGSDVVTLGDVERAAERIRGLAVRTPLKPSLALSERLGVEVLIKIETAQPTGAFKLRGAANAVLSLSAAQRARGVTAMSTGNHGRALAWVGRRLGVRTVICVSEQVPESKVERMRQLGAEVVVHGADQEVATRFSRSLEESEGLTYVSPFDDAAVIAGQGTVALEIFADRPDVDTLVVPVSGGGLIGGMAVVAAGRRPRVRLLGAGQRSGPAMHDSLRAGRIVPVEEVPSLADALQGGMPSDNRYTLELSRRYVERILLADEDELAAAMRWAFFEERLVLEGGGAAGIAALLQPASRPLLGRKVVVVATGDNVDGERFLDVVSAGRR